MIQVIFTLNPYCHLFLLEGLRKAMAPIASMGLIPIPSWSLRAYRAHELAVSSGQRSRSLSLSYHQALGAQSA